MAYVPPCCLARLCSFAWLFTHPIGSSHVLEKLQYIIVPVQRHAFVFIDASHMRVRGYILLADKFLSVRMSLSVYVHPLAAVPSISYLFWARSIDFRSCIRMFAKLGFVNDRWSAIDLEATTSFICKILGSLLS